MTHTIDATNKPLGRTASEVASILMGKHSPAVERNKLVGDKVVLINTSKAAISLKKKQTKEYETYSGHTGGQKLQTLEKMIEKKGYSEAFRVAVYGMLPNNRLRAIMMKNLTITE